MKNVAPSLALFLALSLGAPGQPAPSAPAGLPPERFQELQRSAAAAKGAVAESPPAAAFGIAPGKFADLQDALEEAQLSEGAIATLSDRIEELMAQRDQLVIAAALSAHPELRDELEIFRKGQADQKIKGKAALGQRRKDIATGAVPRPSRRKGKN